jgi:hypothetical protein
MLNIDVGRWMCSLKNPLDGRGDLRPQDPCLGASAAPIPRGMGKKVLPQKATVTITPSQQLGQGQVESGFQRSGLSTTYGRATS